MRLFYSILIVFGVLSVSCGGQESSVDEGNKSPETEQTGTKPFTELYDNGQPKIKGMIVDGQRDGLWVSFYEDGVRWTEENYINGKLEGRTINFYPSGLLRFRGQYMDGEKAGLWQFYDEEGKLIREEVF